MTNPFSWTLLNIWVTILSIIFKLDTILLTLELKHNILWFSIQNFMINLHLELTFFRYEEKNSNMQCDQQIPFYKKQKTLKRKGTAKRTLIWKSEKNCEENCEVRR